MTSAMLIPLQRATAAWRTAHSADIDDVRIFGMHCNKATFAGASGITITPGNRAVIGVAGHADARVVLLRAVDAVGELVMRAKIIELPGQLIVDARKSFAPVKTHARAAVVALDHALRIMWVKPEIMVVTMRC